MALQWCCQLQIRCIWSIDKRAWDRDRRLGVPSPERDGLMMISRCSIFPENDSACCYVATLSQAIYCLHGSNVNGQIQMPKRWNQSLFNTRQMTTARSSFKSGVSPSCSRAIGQKFKYAPSAQRMRITFAIVIAMGVWLILTPTCYVLVHNYRS